jgi:ribosomal protein L29
VADLNKFLGSGGRNAKLHEVRASVRDASPEELQDALNDAQLELLNLRTQSMSQQLPDVMRMRAVRKLVARIHTELGARSRTV